MKVIKKIAKLLLLLFIAIQFFRPEKNIDQGSHLAEFLNETNPPENVETILTNSCYDCHSSNTAYPWYNNIAPVSWWISGHIKEAKGNLNLSDWDSYSKRQKVHKLEEVIEVIDEGKMPLKQYAWIHKNAGISKEQGKAVIEWARLTKALYELGPQPR
ncbi:heme-binding domain-containing protein [Eudoraea adriatica]|uniref:heme-binding domain-containing protein n=1 Tax=Eudoraea adriatica TaxID=446681 RepID=UPI00036FFB31|nr:heme-binding domain-containing protein [Eudoraea adriatica]